MDNIKLPSGAVLGLQIAVLKKASRLKKALLTELIGVPFNIPKMVDGKPDVAAFFKQDVSAIKDAILKLLVSDAVEAAVNDCMTCCTYLGADKADTGAIGTNIDGQTFEPEQARQDILPASWEVIQLNVFPFFGSLSALLSTLSTTASGSPPK